MSRNSFPRGSVWIWIAAFFLLAAGSSVAAEKPVVGLATRHGKSVRLTQAARTAVARGPEREVPNQQTPKRGAGLSRATADAAVQSRFGLSLPQPLLQFDGGSDDANAEVAGLRVVPPDTEGDVGPGHYVQFVNDIATIFDKSGSVVLGPFPGNAFWLGLGGPCETQNDGDPLVRYDRQADRWVVSQFALPNFPDGPFYQCFAVSATGDPTGEYWQYEFKTSDDFFTDYGKLGVWPDAYYMSFNMFGPSGEFQGGAYAFDRAAMLTGAPATMIAFNTGSQGGALPSDLDGATPPPAGSPNYFLTFDVAPSRLLEWQFHVDWSTPASSTLDGPVEIPVADFLYPVCDASRSQCVPQADTSEKLETLDDKMMYRLVYRNFGDHESLVVNHTVGTAQGSAAPRWYEIRSPGSNPVVYQQGTYAPDATFRWMGSIAMDGQGNIALGYSTSSASSYPSIAVTGRLAGDPLGTMGAEDVWLEGGGSQVLSSSRWGDYSTMSIDPTDDCTFWYTQEYYGSTTGFDFQTRIGAFRFPSCTSGPAGSLQGVVTHEGEPVAGATVTATPSAPAAPPGASTTTTDAAGHYQFLSLPAGTYSVTASRFGYVPATAGVVVVPAGGSASQDFSLDLAPTIVIDGTVRDGSGQGWPLYAKMIVSGPSGFASATLFTDPVTGYYSIPLSAGGGAIYQFAVSAVAPGYVTGGGALDLSSTFAPLAPLNQVANWRLTAAPACNAPGYGEGAFTGAPVLAEGFDSATLPAGWSVDTISGASWEFYDGGDPCFQFDGNRTGGSGGYAILNSACRSDGSTPDNSSLVTAPVDLSTRTSAAIRWSNDFIDQDFGSSARVDVSADGGVSWANVWQSPGDVPGPGTQIADISTAAGHADVRARFHYQGTWAWWWQVDDVEIGTFACTPIPGGLVVGSVRDANTGAGIVGASVANASGGDPAVTFSTADDPAQTGGLYALFSKSGPQSFAASYPAHETQTLSATAVPNAATRLDFSLAAGLLQATPRPLTLFIAPGGAQDLTLTLSNSGTGAAAFVIQELSVIAPAAAAARPAKPVAPADLTDRRAALKRVPFGRMNDPRQTDLAAPPRAPKDAPAILQAGEVAFSFPTGLTAGSGLVYDGTSNRVWVSNPDNPGFGLNGDGFEHAFLPDGAPTADSIDIHATGGEWQADGAYDARTGMLWQVNVGGDTCLFEMDPVAKIVTGKRICGPWTSTQRAVAYDYATDTFYVGGANEATVYHVDASGNLIDSAYVAIAITGLAYNATTRHLFITSQGASPYDIWIADAANGYSIVGGFRPTAGGAPVLPVGGGASLEADCSGLLYVLDPEAQVVYAFASGETGWCVNQIPWLSEDPTAGAVASAGSQPVTVSFHSAGLLPGWRGGSLLFQTDTPTPVDPVPVDFTVLFSDVPEGTFAWNFIYGAAGAGVMPGCAPQTPTFAFCPNEVVTRRSMAGFIERAVHGASTPPPVYLGAFGDVLAGSFNANYIEGLVDDGITAGCSVAPPLYCPDASVTRAQMAVFVWKGEHGDEPPPACTGVFADVPCPDSFAADYIEAIAAEGVTAGCGGGNFCPNASITNAQMAVFLVKAFGISYQQ